MNTIATSTIQAMSSYKLPSHYWLSCSLFPELDKSRTIIQKDGKTVFHHIMKVLDSLDIKNPVTLWSALFHDLGKCHDKYMNYKPDTKNSRFPEHEKVSTQIAIYYLEMWKADEDTIDKVTRVIQTHMFDIKCNLTPKTVRNFIAKVGIDNITNWFIVRRADSISYSATDGHIIEIINPFQILIQSELDKASKDFGLNINKDHSGIKISGE